MDIVFHAHSGLRWIVLLALVIIVFRSLYGFFGGGAYLKFDKTVNLVAVISMDIMLLLGIVLYFGYSPHTQYFTFNMDDPIQRFWAVEHVALMLFAIAAAHIGKGISGKSDDRSVKFRFQLIFFGISLVLVLAGIPWGRL